MVIGMLVMSLAYILNSCGSEAKAESAPETVIMNNAGDSISGISSFEGTAVVDASLPGIVGNYSADNVWVKSLDQVKTPVRVGIFYIYSSNNYLAFSHNISGKAGLVFYTKTDSGIVFITASDQGVTIMQDFSAAKGADGALRARRHSGAHADHRRASSRH
jgi:hypothetical protein